MSTVRQRKNTDAAAGGDKKSTVGRSSVPATTKKPAHVPTWKDWIPVFALFGVGLVILSGAYWRYGPTVLLGQGWKDLKMTSEQWQSHLTSHTGDHAGRKLVFIGGPHRGGTTYIWRNFKLHPEVSGFGTAFETGSDESEGIFMQDVYTKMGIGMEFMEMMKPEAARSGVRMTGLGRYALGKEEDVHWTETHEKVSRRRGEPLYTLILMPSIKNTRSDAVTYAHAFNVVQRKATRPRSRAAPASVLFTTSNPLLLISARDDVSCAPALGLGLVHTRFSFSFSLQQADSNVTFDVFFSLHFILFINIACRSRSTVRPGC